MIVCSGDNFKATSRSNCCFHICFLSLFGLGLIAFLPVAVTDLIFAIFFVILALSWLGAFLGTIVFPRTHILYVHSGKIEWRIERRGKVIWWPKIGKMHASGEIAINDIAHIYGGAGEVVGFFVRMKDGKEIPVPTDCAIETDAFYEHIRRVAPYIELDQKVIREKYVREHKNKWKRVFGRK